jgi:hypothetical protein
MRGKTISKEDGQRIEQALHGVKGDPKLYRRIQIVPLRASQEPTQEAIAKARMTLALTSQGR